MHSSLAFLVLLLDKMAGQQQTRDRCDDLTCVTLLELMSGYGGKRFDFKVIKFENADHPLVGISKKWLDKEKNEWVPCAKGSIFLKLQEWNVLAGKLVDALNDANDFCRDAGLIDGVGTPVRGSSVVAGAAKQHASKRRFDSSGNASNAGAGTYTPTKVLKETKDASVGEKVWTRGPYNTKNKQRLANAKSVSAPVTTADVEVNADAGDE